VKNEDLILDWILKLFYQLCSSDKTVSYLKNDQGKLVIFLYIIPYGRICRAIASLEAARNFMNWITIIGIIMIAAGTVLTYVGQNISTKSDVANLQKSINEKNSRIEELVKGNKELLEKVDKYQETLAGKEKEIDGLEAEVNKLNLTAPKLLPDGRIAASPGVFYASEYSDEANQVRNLFNQGKFDEAYAIADKLKKKNPKFGLAHFLLGTIEIQRGNIIKGVESLEHAISLELTDEDRAWAYHNLGIAALRNQNINKAIEYLKKAIQTNPNMKESKNTLQSIEEQLERQKE